MATVTYQRNGATRTLPAGFSWTTLFFGAVPSVIRGHWKMAWLVACVDIAAVIVMGHAAYGNDFYVVLAVARIASAMTRNHELHKHYQANGWRKPMATKLEAANT